MICLDCTILLLTLAIELVLYALMMAETVEEIE